MSQPIYAKHIKYNANSRNNHVGDCVKRALSVAYRLDYDEVTNELNKIKRRKHMDAFNESPVYEEFIRIHGYRRTGRPVQFGLEKSNTVEDFCQHSPSGTFLVLCGKREGIPDHLVAIIDGDIWDSWNSSSWYLYQIWEITPDTSEHAIELSAEQISEDIIAHVTKCLDKSASKMPWANFIFKDVEVVDTYTYTQEIVCKLDASKLHLDYAKWWTPGYTYTVKVNPRLSHEDNVSKLKSKLWVKVREWAYSIRKEIEDDLKIESQEFHPNLGSDDKALVIKLPEWCRPLITNAEDRGSNDWCDRYLVDMDALPDDPHFETDPCVTFYADTIPELRSNIEDYRKHFWRFGWDY